jgi:hypothetical protein
MYPHPLHPFMQSIHQTPEALILPGQPIGYASNGGVDRFFLEAESTHRVCRLEDHRRDHAHQCRHASVHCRQPLDQFLGLRQHDTNVLGGVGPAQAEFEAQVDHGMMFPRKLITPLIKGGVCGMDVVLVRRRLSCAP